MAETWYAQVGDQTVGPLSRAELVARVRSRALPMETMVRRASDDAWRHLHQYKGLLEPAVDAIAPPPGSSTPLATTPTDGSTSPQTTDRPVSSRLATGLAAVSLVVSVGALVLSALAFSHSPLGEGVDAYDFTTPRAAVESYAAAKVNGDYMADVELRHRIALKKNQEFSATLEFRKEATAGSVKILFISYEQGGIKEYAIRMLEKDADTGLWSTAVGKTWAKDASPELQKQIMSWIEKGEL